MPTDSTVKLEFKELLNKEQLGYSEPFPVTNMTVHLINSEQIGISEQLCDDQKVPYYQVWLYYVLLLFYYSAVYCAVLKWKQYEQQHFTVGIFDFFFVIWFWSKYMWSSILDYGSNQFLPFIGKYLLLALV